MSLAIDLSGRRAFVTGVTSGIGLGIARQLARAGCSVAGCGRSAADSAGAQAFESVVRAEGVEAHYLRADVSVADEARGVARRAAEALGGLDVLVSNAGRNVFAGAEGCTESQWDECMQLDLAAHWRVAQASREALLASCAAGRKPVVIVIGSNHMHATIPGCFPYNVAKAGMGALVQSLAIEWGPAIRAVGIAPGFIDTAGNDVWFDSFPDPLAERARTGCLHPTGRIGTVDEVGALCAFLASPFAGFVCGTTILADGGRSALLQDS